MRSEQVTGQFNDSFAPIVDGVAIAVQNYAHWLNQSMGPAYVIAPAAPQHLDHYEFQVLRYFSLPVPPFRPYRMGIHVLDHAFWQALRAAPFELVHAHCPFTSGLLARRIAHSRGIPLVATFHTKYRDNLARFTSSRALLDRYAARIADYYASADQVWVPNLATGATLCEYGYRGPMEVVPNGSDMGASGDRLSALRLQANRELGLAIDEPVLLFVGQHVWEKNVAFLIQALALLEAGGERFTMLFVGDGYAADQMRTMASEAGLGHSARFLGLVRDRSRLERLYARADLFLFPSLYDNAPLTVREAAAACLPAVLIAGCNAAEGIINGQNGFVSENSPRAYALQVAKLLHDPDLRQRVGLAARATLFRSWQDIVSEVQGRYTDLIRQHAKQPSVFRPWPLRLPAHQAEHPLSNSRVPLPLLRAKRAQTNRWTARRSRQNDDTAHK